MSQIPTKIIIILQFGIAVCDSTRIPGRQFFCLSVHFEHFRLKSLQRPGGDSSQLCQLSTGSTAPLFMVPSPFVGIFDYFPDVCGCG